MRAGTTGDSVGEKANAVATVAVAGTCAAESVENVVARPKAEGDRAALPVAVSPVVADLRAEVLRNLVAVPVVLPVAGPRLRVEEDEAPHAKGKTA